MTDRSRDEQCWQGCQARGPRRVLGAAALGRGACLAGAFLEAFGEKGSLACCATTRSKPLRARSSAPGRRRKRASWCRARIRPWISNSICSGSVPACRWPSSTLCEMARSQRSVPGAHHVGQGVAHGAGAVVELHRAADVDAAPSPVPPTPAAPSARRGTAAAAGRAAGAWRGWNTSASKRWWYSRMTEICSSSREPKWAKTPDLLMPVTSASAPMDRPSSPNVRGQAQRRVQDGGAGVAWPFCSALFNALAATAGGGRGGGVGRGLRWWGFTAGWGWISREPKSKRTIVLF